MTTAWPKGFRAHAGNMGIKDAATDFSVVIGDPGTTSAAVFTQSRFAGCSVDISRAHAAGGTARGVVTISKNANVATGPDGTRNAHAVLDGVGAALSVPPSDLLIGSTGVIGRPYPMDRVHCYLGGLAGRAFDASPEDVALAMMTTDTVPKLAARTVGDVSIVGVAKGVGMIEPDMATLLTWTFTDARVDAATLDRAFRAAIDRSFNSLSIDTDTSTSDSAAVFASGAAGSVDVEAFGAALAEVCLDLALQIARDDEGATKLLEVRVDGARDDRLAKTVAKSVVNSPLVKTAVHGADPNWGRVAMAVGKVYDPHIRPDTTVIRFGAMEVYPKPLDDRDLDALAAIMRGDHVLVHVTLGTGTGAATVYGCDLS
ncbi:MAG TPA: bifunctional glutamate N-acetyltransferase/amino-acid acetyltransferase ArgJ, partial [Acidimicrobiales bacterium]|nr:bifunctional glutamate N-acetyltransferase/amino-acid acetyltransferase ArgJ [Acidimicrobiales bacterium]